MQLGYSQRTRLHVGFADTYFVLEGENLDGCGWVLVDFGVILFLLDLVGFWKKGLEDGFTGEAELGLSEDGLGWFWFSYSHVTYAFFSTNKMQREIWRVSWQSRHIWTFMLPSRWITACWNFLLYKYRVLPLVNS